MDRLIKHRNMIVNPSYRLLWLVILYHFLFELMGSVMLAGVLFSRRRLLGLLRILAIYMVAQIAFTFIAAFLDAKKKSVACNQTALYHSHCNSSGNYFADLAGKSQILWDGYVSLEKIRAVEKLDVLTKVRGLGLFSSGERYTLSLCEDNIAFVYGLLGSW